MSAPTTLAGLVADRLKATVQGNRVAGLLAGLLEKVEASFPGLQAVDEVDRLQAGARAVARRRELELCMGERFARMLAPAKGGAAP